MAGSYFLSPYTVLTVLYIMKSQTIGNIICLHWPSTTSAFFTELLRYSSDPLYIDIFSPIVVHWTCTLSKTAWCDGLFFVSSKTLGQLLILNILSSCTKPISTFCFRCFLTQDCQDITVCCMTCLKKPACVGACQDFAQDTDNDDPRLCWVNTV